MGTITDLDGNYSISIPRGSQVEVRAIGYRFVTKTVLGDETFDVQLVPDTEQIEETVVVGYGVRKKSVVTGSISSVDGESMRSTSVTRPEQALQGKTSGVQVLSSSGAPGSSIKIRVRGYSSNGNADPLYIVDGLRTDDISTLEPSSIESMEVLKDGASAAIYGAEGGNGVVLITTKRGKEGRTEINYDFQYTLQMLGKTSDMMNGEQYLDYMQQAGQISSSVVWDGTNTDWVDAVFENASMQKHSLSISGGNDKMNYFGSLSYLNQEGIMVGDYDNYERYSGMFNGSVQAKKWLKMSSSIQINRSIQHSVYENNESLGVMASALMLDPLTPVYYEDSNNLPTHVQDLIDAGNSLMTNADGKYYGISEYVTGEIINPLVRQYFQQTTTTRTSFMGNVALDITPFEGFSFTSKLAANYYSKNVHVYEPEYYYNAEQFNQEASVSEADTEVMYWQWENYASYTRTFADKHNVTLMLGTSSSSKDTKTVNAEGYPLLKDQESYANLDYISSQTNSTVSGYDIRDRKASFFGRVNYEYNNKYLFEATLRYDGAGNSILPEAERWGLFPAVSVGWVATEEDWFPTFGGTVSFFKLRGSWGRNGSLSNLSEYAYSANISSTTTNAVTGDNVSRLYPMGDGSYSVAAIPSSLGNYNLTWETSEQFDIGLDLRMLASRLTFTMDWFHKETKDLITENTPALEAGNDASPVNGGNVLNKGFEFDLGWRDTIGDFSYSISANLSTLSNKVTYLDPSIDRLTGGYTQTNWYATAFEEGYPVWYFRGYKTDGLTAEGDVNFVDVNGDGSITTADYTMIGSPIPDFTYGLTINLAYKGLDFTLFMNGSQGNDILYTARRPDRLTTNKLAAFYTDSWSETNTSAKYPSPASQCSSTNFWYSDMMVFDGSYLKIKQIQFGYTFPKKWMSKVDISNLRVYVSLDDFFTITDYPGMDPEASSSSNYYIGMDRGFYPNSRKVMFGLSLTL